MQEKEGERALGVSEVPSLTVMRDARGHRGILKSWFHNKWWFCFFRAKCGLPHYSLKTVGWCRTTDGLLDPKSQAGFHKLLPSKYKHMALGCCPRSEMFQNGQCGFNHKDKGGQRKQE